MIQDHRDTVDSIPLSSSQTSKAKGGFASFGPDENPERVRYFAMKKLREKETIKEELEKQIKENHERRQIERDNDHSYGQKLNHMA